MSTHLQGDLGLLLPALAVVVALAAFLASASPVRAFQGSIIEDWDKVKAPPAPEVKPVTVDPRTTALLILDIEKRTTNMERRPRAVASVPVIRTLLEAARAKGLPVAYSTTSNSSPGDILPEVAPRPAEPVVKSSVDKFFKTDLEAILREKGVQRVILVGTAAEGAVLNTAVAAAIRGMEVIVPVDGLSSSELYAEQYVCWHLLNAPGTRGKVTLTKVALINFGP